MMIIRMTYYLVSEHGISILIDIELHALVIGGDSLWHHQGSRVSLIL